jgi:hypothetical protein
MSNRTPTDQERGCRGCSRKIHLLSTAEGAVIPLDRESPVYEIVTDLTGQRIARRLENAFVTHFASCPKANEFSAAGKKRPPV